MAQVEEVEYEELITNIDALDMLELIYYSQYKEVIRIRTLPGLSEAVWAYYDLHEIEGLKEQLLLKNALVQLRLAIKELIRNARKPNKVKTDA